MTCLVLDVGNTSATLALARDGRITNITRLEATEATPVNMRKIILRISGKRAIDGAAISSVVPSVTSRWTAAVKKTLGLRTLVVDRKLKLGIRVDYPSPETIGSDRLANAVAAVSRYHAPVIVADFGTALTFDIIRDGAVYVGGVIAPGLPLMTDYLADKTALLPKIRLTGRCHWVGRSTEGAMRIGARIGYRGMVREILEHVTPHMCRYPALCATGGFARWALDGLDLPFHFDSDLTLFGIWKIYEMNRKEI